MAERDAGADFAAKCGACGSGSVGLRGRGVPQISHSRRRGLLRNVHAGHATSSDELSATGTGGEGAGEFDRLSFPTPREEDRLSDEDGSEVESECEAKGTRFCGMSMGAFMEDLGTPHSAQTMDADDVRPMGLRLLQTSHSQN